MKNIIKRNILCFLSLNLVVLFLFCSCAPKQVGDDAVAEPDLSYDGFLRDEITTGGSLFPNANAKYMTFEQDGADTLVNIDFIGGSRMSGGTAETASSLLPPYSVYMLESPCRLAIEFDSLTYSDFTRTLDTSSAPLIFGCINQKFAVSSEQLIVYIQLNSDVMYQTSESNGRLQIRLRPIEKAAPAPSASDNADDTVTDILVTDTADNGGYYAVVNSYREYCNGEIPSDIGLTPVLSTDGETVLLISDRFNSLEAAENYIVSTLDTLGNAASSLWHTELIADGDFPVYSDENAFSAAYGLDVARKNDEEIALEVLIPDGLYLTVTPDRTALVYSKRIVSGMGVDEYEYEQLYTIKRGGTGKPLLDYQFSTIDSARFSPDGRKLAVLDRAAENTHLYIFDTDNWELLCDLCDVGFGDTVSAYTWDSMGSIVYAIGGSGAIQVHQYDFNVPTESKRHSIVDKKGADEGSIAYFSGEVYFSQTEFESGSIIYRVKPDGGIRREFLSGSSFALSNSGEYLAYSDAGGDYASSEKAPLFALYNMSTGESTTITQDFAVYDFVWSWDASKVFYIENKLSGDKNESADGENAVDSNAQTEAVEQNDPYPYTLWVFDIATGENKSVISLPNTSINVSNRTNEVYLSYYDEETMGKVVRATYIIDLND